MKEINALKLRAWTKLDTFSCPIEIVLEIFVNENIKETIILESFNTKLNEVLSKII